MLSTKGTYKVKETNLFSEEPIVQKKKMQINERQRQSRNGYTNPRIQDTGRTNLQMRNNHVPVRHVRQIKRHGYYNQSNQNKQNPQM